MWKQAKRLSLVICLLLLPLLISCASRQLVLHPLTVQEKCSFTGEDICHPAIGYTAFSDYYLNAVMGVKIDK